MLFKFSFGIMITVKEVMSNFQNIFTLYKKTILLGLTVSGIKDGQEKIPENEPANEKDELQQNRFK